MATMERGKLLLSRPPLSFHNNRVHNLHNGCIHGDSILAQHQLPSFHSSHDHIRHIHDVHSHDGSSQAQHQPLSFHNNCVHNLHNGCIHDDSILAQQRQLLRLPSFHSSHDHIHHIHDVHSHDGSSQAQLLSFHSIHDHIHHIHIHHDHIHGNILVQQQLRQGWQE